LLLATRTHAQSRKRAAQRQEKHPGQAAKRSNQAAQIFRAPGEEEEEEEE
jgi:hypothetical protein